MKLTAFHSPLHISDNMNYLRLTTNSAYVEYDQSIPLKHIGVKEQFNFPFVTSVTWIYDERASAKHNMVRPPPPSLLFSVPRDIFYPFEISGGLARSNKVQYGLVYTLVLLTTFTCWS